jgi:hypothetical protein
MVSPRVRDSYGYALVTRRDAGENGRDPTSTGGGCPSGFSESKPSQIKEQSCLTKTQPTEPRTLRTIKSPKSKRKEPHATKHAPCWNATDSYTKEMEKMSITNSPYQKVVLQTGTTSVSSLHLQIGASNVNPITASNKGELRADLLVDSQIVSMELESEAFTVPVSRLIDLWLARFGNTWVDLTTLEEEEFFHAAFKRLKQLGEVEVHYLTDRARYVCRKPE